MISDLKKEKEILEKSKANKSAFDELYKYFLPDVYRFSYSLSNNKHETEDITSQVFIEFFKKIETFEWKEVSLKYWLFRTARNLWYTKARMPEIVEYNDDIHYSKEVEISFVDEIINKDLLEKIREEIKKLSPIEQETINLRIWESMQFKEIADLQEEKEDTVKKRFYRSIEKLQKKFEEKKLNAIIPFPFLFTGLKQIAQNPDFIVPKGLSSANIINLINTKTNMFTTIKTFLATKAGIATIIIAITGTTIIAGTVGTYIVVKDKPEVKQAIAKITNQKIDKENNSIPVEIKSTETPTPIKESEFTDYTDTTLKVSFKYRKTLIVTKNNPNSTYYSLSLTKGIDTRPSFNILQQTLNPTSLFAVNMSPSLKETISFFDASDGTKLVKRIYASNVYNGKQIYMIEYYRFVPSATNGCTGAQGCYDSLFINNRFLRVFISSEKPDFDTTDFDNIVKSIVLI